MSCFAAVRAALARALFSLKCPASLSNGGAEPDPMKNFPFSNAHDMSFRMSTQAV